VLLHRVGDDSAEHHCVVAGLRTDGALTDVWSDASAYLDGLYVAYVPRCECGWTGPPFSTTPSGYAACEQLCETSTFSRSFAPQTHSGLTKRAEPGVVWLSNPVRGNRAGRVPIGPSEISFKCHTGRRERARVASYRRAALRWCLFCSAAW
jgi:hypothetical protein